MIAVIDTSAFLRLFIPDGPLPVGIEEFFQGVELGVNIALAPELMLVEAANVLNKKRLQAVLTRDECNELLSLMMDMPIRFIPHAEIIQTSLSLAEEQGLTVYDALFAALAKHKSARLFTADKLLGQAAKKLGLIL